MSTCPPPWPWAVLDSIPVLTDALTGASEAALVGGLFCCRLERRAAQRAQPRPVEPRWLAARWNVVGAVAGLGDPPDRRGTLNATKRALRALLAGAVLALPAALIGEARDFAGSHGWPHGSAW